MENIQVVTIVGTNIILILTILATTIGVWFHLDKKIETQNNRTDKLYEMFIDVVKKEK